MLSPCLPWILRAADAVLLHNMSQEREKLCSRTLKCLLQGASKKQDVQTASQTMSLNDKNPLRKSISTYG